VPTILVVNPSLPVKTVKELVALAKKHPNEILYASIGNGAPPHLSAELFNSMAGIKMTHVPYKGAAPSMISLLAGETQLTFTTVLVALPHVKTARLRALGVASLKRAAVMPDVPTIDEAGVRGYESNAWYGLLAPANASKEAVARMNSEINRVLADPAVRAAMVERGLEPLGGTAEKFGEHLRTEIAKYARVVREAKMKID